MSVKVDLEQLAATMKDHPFAYLLTVSDDQRAHAVAVTPVARDGALRVEGLGNRTRANLTDRPDVTLLFPPGEPGGYSLIVDGRASGDGEGATVTPVNAVLHRPAEHAPGEVSDTGCGSDCVHI